MKKKTFTLAALLVFALSTAACAGKTAETGSIPSVTERSQTQEQTAAESKTGEMTSAIYKNREETAEYSIDLSEEGRLTGTVQENKGFLITVVSSADSEAYVFALDETQSETYKNIKTGDKITVSYTNGLPTPDNLETVVTEIQPAK